MDVVKVRKVAAYLEATSNFTSNQRRNLAHLHLAFIATSINKPYARFISQNNERAVFQLNASAKTVVIARRCINEYN